MNAERPRQQLRPQNSQRRSQLQAPAARGLTHEPICLKETRVCWIEFGAAIACLVVGLILVLAGVSVDSSTVGSAGVSSNKPAGVQAVIYIGVVLLIAGAVLLVVFGVHFYRVKSRLDSAKAEQFAQLGIRPVSRYESVPGQNLGPGPLQLPRPPVLPLPSRQPQELEEEPPPPQLPPMSSRLQPMPSYREGAFYNLGFSGDETDGKAQPQRSAKYTVEPPPVSTVELARRGPSATRGAHEAPSASFSRGAWGGADAPPAGAAPPPGAVGVQSSRSYHAGLSSAAAPKFLHNSSSGQNFYAMANRLSDQEPSDFRQKQVRTGPQDSPENWQRPPNESPPSQTSPPPYYSRDPFPILSQPTDHLTGRFQGRDFTRSELREQSRNQSYDQPKDDFRVNTQFRDHPRAQTQFQEQARDQPRDPRDQPRDPRNQPRDPRDQPRDPRDQPRDQPRDPRDQARDPRDQPRDPRDQPRDPRDQARDPRDQPRDPRNQFRDQPRDPRDQPRDPKDQPRDLRYQARDPRDPRDQPRDPRDQPRDLRYQARDPRDPRYQARDPRDQARDPRYQARSQQRLQDLARDQPQYPSRDHPQFSDQIRNQTRYQAQFRDPNREQTNSAYQQAEKPLDQVRTGGSETKQAAESGISGYRSSQI